MAIKLGTQTAGVMLVTSAADLSAIALLDTNPIDPVSRTWSISYFPGNLASAPTVTGPTNNPASFTPPAAGEWYVVRLVRTLALGTPETLELPICVPDASGTYALPPPGIPADVDPAKTIVNLNDNAKKAGWSGSVIGGVPGLDGAVRKALSNSAAAATPASTSNAGTQSIDHFKRAIGQAADVKEYGAIGDNTVNDAPALVSAFAGDANINYSAGTYKIATTVTLGGAGKRHNFAEGALLHVPTGVTLTIDGAGLEDVPHGQQIFQVDTGGRVSFGPNAGAVARPGWFGADLTGAADSGPAFRALLRAFRARSWGTCELPPVDLLVTTPDVADTGYASQAALPIAHGNVKIRGAGHGVSRIVLGPSFQRIAILFEDFPTSQLEPTPIENVEVSGLDIAYQGTGANPGASLGAVQLNRVNNSIIDVRLFGDGAGMGNSLVDGVAWAYWCKNGWFRIYSDGLSKCGGPYIVSGENINGEAIVRNAYSTAIQWALAAQISAAHNSSVHVDAADVHGYGTSIFITGAIDGTISALVSQTHFTFDYGSGVHLGTVFIQRDCVGRAQGALGVFNATTQLVEELIPSQPKIVTFSGSTWTTRDSSGSAAAHNYLAGDAVQISVTGGAMPTGITAGATPPTALTTYFVSSASLGASTFQLADTQAHANAGTNTITPTGGSGNLKVQTVPYSTDGGRTYAVVLEQAPAQTLTTSMLVHANCAVPKDVVISGSAYKCAADGINGASAVLGAVAERITFDNFRSTFNGGGGAILNGCVHGLFFRNLIAHHNGILGAQVTDIGMNDTTQGLIRDVVFDGGYIKDNGPAAGGYGIVLQSVDNVFVSESTIVETGGSRQANGVYFTASGIANPRTVTAVNTSTGAFTSTAHGFPAGQAVAFDTTGTGPTGLPLVSTPVWVSTAGLATNSFQVADTLAHALAGTNTIVPSTSGTGTLKARPWKPCTNVVLKNFQHPGYTVSPIGGAVYDYPPTGRFDLDYAADPEGVVYAPLESTSRNTVTADRFIKRTDTTTPSGWATQLVSGTTIVVAGAVVGANGVIATGGALTLQCKVGSSIFFEEFTGAFIGLFTASTIRWGVGATVYGQGLAPSWTQDTKTVAGDAADWTWTAGAPQAGSNGKAGGFVFNLVDSDGTGAKASFSIHGTATVFVVTRDGKISFYGGTPVSQPTIAGALSAVIDANAKAVLTSIIAALKPSGGLNLAQDGTT